MGESVLAGFEGVSPFDVSDLHAESAWRMASPPTRLFSAPFFSYPSLGRIALTCSLAYEMVDVSHVST